MFNHYYKILSEPLSATRYRPQHGLTNVIEETLFCKLLSLIKQATLVSLMSKRALQ